MAAEVIRTAEQDVAEAFAALDAATRELENWRAHLHRVTTGSEPGIAMQVRRSACIVAAKVSDATVATVAATSRAMAQVNSVS